MVVHRGLTASAFPSRPARDQLGGRPWDLPVLAHGDSAHAQVLRPRGVRCQLAKAPPAMLPSDHFDGVGTPRNVMSRLNSPACACPCQRFADALTNADA